MTERQRGIMTELPILERVRRRLAAGTAEPTPHTRGSRAPC